MNELSQTLRSPGTLRIVILFVVLGSIVGLLGYFGTRLTEPPMTLLYGDLDTSDSGQIVTRLEAMDVAYELRAGGTQIYVPADRALRLRMAMAEEGLPSGGSVGYEVFDRSNTLGATRSMQNINLLRALEGELARTIGSISQIAAARVHLVMPRRELFARDRQEPSASIMVKLLGGNRLDKTEVMAIRHLVAAAVPGLKPSRVSIVDDRGTLLARSGDGDGEEIATLAEDHRVALETRLKRMIEGLLEQSIGLGRVRAEVSAEIDFDRITTSAEIYDPESQVVRSSQTVEERSDSSEFEGAEAVSVSTSLPGAEQYDQAAPRSLTTTTRTEETTNYEISKTIRNHVRESGTIKRLSVAVLVDGTYTTGSDGARVYQPRGEDEIEKLSTLVRTAIGYDAERGDTMEIVNLEFAPVEPIEAADAPQLVNLAKGDYFKIAEIAVMFVVALLVVLMVLRPLARHAFAAAMPGREATAGGQPQALPSPGEEPAQLAASAPEATPEEAPAPQQSAIDLERVEGQMRAASIKRVGELVDNHPDDALTIIRNWLHQEA